MSSPRSQAVPINECVHKPHRFDGACDVIEVVSPDGRPVGGPTDPTTHGMLLRHAVEVMLSFAAGFVCAIAVVLWV